MLRICLIVAIAAGLVAGALSFIKIQDIITTTRAARDDWNNKYTTEAAEHAKTRATLKKTQGELESTKQTLAQTKSDLDAETAKADDLDKKNNDLTAELDKTRADRDSAQQELEQWHLIPGGLKPSQVKDVIDELAKTRKARDVMATENKLLLADRNELQRELDTLVGTDRPVILPAGLKGTIVAVDPKYAFVVLDIGRDQGAKERGEMLVNKDGRFLGKVRIISVQKDRCVANILPDWQRGDIEEGDEVLY